MRPCAGILCRGRIPTQDDIADDRQPLVLSVDLDSGRLCRGAAAKTTVGPKVVVVQHDVGNNGRVRLFEAAEGFPAIPDLAIEPLLDVVIALLIPEVYLAYVFAVRMQGVFWRNLT